MQPLAISGEIRPLTALSPGPSNMVHFSPLDVNLRFFQEVQNPRSRDPRVYVPVGCTPLANGTWNCPEGDYVWY